MANPSLKPGLKKAVVLVPFPFDDLSATKLRPAVCLTEPVGDNRHLILAFITSQITDVLEPTDLLVAENHPDFKKTGLHTSSIIRLHRLLTVSDSLLKRQLGRLSDKLWDQVEHTLKILFELSI